MRLAQLADLPGWAYQAVWTISTIGLLYVLGRFVSRRICGRLSRWASTTEWKWDDALIDALQRGVPFWAVLIGCHASMGYWQLAAHWTTMFNTILYVAAWMSMTLIAARLVGKLVVLYGSEFQHAMPVTSLTQHIAKIAVVITGALMIVNGLGVSIAPILTALGVGGLAVALALQDTLSNLFAGFYLTMARQIRVGDYIKLDSGHEGYVEDIGWRATQIRMLPNNMVVVPNNKLSQAIITNFNMPSRDLAFTVEVGVDYSSDLGKVERITAEVGREVMRTVPGGIPGFEPFIRYHTFGDFSVQFTVILRAKEFVDQYLVKHEFLKRLLERYRREGITIPFPTQMVFRKDDE